MTSGEMIASDSLTALLEASAGGDRGAFEKLYESTSGRLLSLALRIVKRRDIAEEILQECYVTIWRKAAQQRGAESSTFGWMATVVRHACIDHIRSSGARHDAAIDIDSIRLAAAGADGTEAWDAIQADKVNSCVESLEHTQREAILLAFYFGMTHGEIAAKLESPLGTVKSWVRRGLKKLKECIDQ